MLSPAPSQSWVSQAWSRSRELPAAGTVTARVRAGVTSMDANHAHTYFHALLCTGCSETWSCNFMEFLKWRLHFYWPHLPSSPARSLCQPPSNVRLPSLMKLAGLGLSLPLLVAPGVRCPVFSDI